MEDGNTLCSVAAGRRDVADAGESAEAKLLHRSTTNLLWTNIKLSVLASVAVAAPVAFLAPWIMAGFGPSFADGTWVLVILCLTSVPFLQLTGLSASPSSVEATSGRCSCSTWDGQRLC